MTAIPSVSAPGKILFATDLTCRSDRALDRATLLARQWGAGLVIVHVIETRDRTSLDRSGQPDWARREDPTVTMRRQIERDLLGDADDLATIDVRVAEGPPVDCILEIAEEEGCGLIVTGVARKEALGRMFVGTTANQLVRRSRVPVLVVRDRAKRPYSSIAVATDFSETSRQGLIAAAGFFPNASIVLLHGYDLPLAGMADAPITSNFREMERDRRADFIDTTPLDPAMRDRIPLLIERGDPVRLIGDYVKDRNVDLTVVGSHGRGALFDALIGSITSRLLDGVEGDLLIVIDPRTRR
jgi:nucleotide-binding universal stress UspA family protein